MADHRQLGDTVVEKILVCREGLKIAQPLRNCSDKRSPRHHGNTVDDWASRYR